MRHLCNHCKKNYPTCDGEIFEFGFDIDPETLNTKEADKIINCNGFEEDE